jgi:hypothetical protein
LFRTKAYLKIKCDLPKLLLTILIDDKLLNVTWRDKMLLLSKRKYLIYFNIKNTNLKKISSH